MRPFHLRPNHGPQAGNSLFVSIMLLTLVTAGVGTLLTIVTGTNTATTAQIDRFEVKRAASSVSRLTAQTLWGNYVSTLGTDDSPRLADMRFYMDGQGLLDQSGVEALGGTPTRVEFVNRLGLPPGDAGAVLLGDMQITSVEVHRIDEVRRSLVYITTRAVSRRGLVDGADEVVEVMTDLFVMEPPPWDGLDFALLANNISCLMCHTTVDDVRRVYGSPDMDDPNQDVRARVGSIESFQFREDPDSLIAGTLYLGGPAVDKNGAEISDWSDISLSGAALDEHGNLIEDSLGNLTTEEMTPADPSDPQPFENLYVDYFDQAEPVDGELPDSFPLPFLDDGGFDAATGAATPGGADNRVVDDNEFDATVASFNGAITGGAIGVVPTGDRVTTDSTAAGLIDGNTSDLGAVTDGNVVLTGTAGEPIRINGDVAIDGDLIISGPIEGAGSLWVKGNIYVVGDLEYNDGVVGSARNFGVAANGSTNALGMTAGGNVVIGDMFRAQWGEGGPVNGTESAPWNFTLGEAAAFNKREWIKTQPELPGQPIQVEVGQEVTQVEQFEAVVGMVEEPIYEWQENGETYEAPIYETQQTGTREEPVYENVTRTNGRPAPYTETWQERVQTGTRTVPVMEQVQIGTETRNSSDRVQVGTREVEQTTYRSYSPQQFEERVTILYEWQTPMHTNPDYMGADFTPRYYAFGEGDPVPIQNGDGYFDPSVGTWISEESAESWDYDGLTLADPNDPNDPLLFPAGGNAAAISTLEPSEGWMDSEVLRGIITDSLTARDADEPFKVDGTVYSSNSIFGVVPNSPSEGTTGKLQVQGALLAADIGLLGPGGTDLLYDPRGQEVLDIRDENALGLGHIGRMPSFQP